MTELLTNCLTSIILLYIIIGIIQELFGGGSILESKNGEILNQLLSASEETLFSTEESARDFSHIFNSEAFAIVILDGNGYLDFWNMGAQKLFGYSSYEIIGEPFYKLISKNQRSQIEACFDKGPSGSYKLNAKESIEFIGIRKDKSGFPFEMSCNSVSKGDAVYYVTVIHDLTKSRRADRAILKSEAFFQLVYDHNRDIMILTDRHNRIVWANAAWYRGLGFKPDVQKTPFDRVHAGDRERVQMAWKAIVKRGESFKDIIYRYQIADGSYVYFETTIQKLPGEPYYYIRSHDATERIKLEELNLLKTRYLEITLTVSNLLAVPLNSDKVVEVIRQKLDLLAASLIIFNPGNNPEDKKIKKLNMPHSVSLGEIEAEFSGISGEAQKPTLFLKKLRRSKRERGILMAPLLNSQQKKIGILLMAKKVDEDFNHDEIGLVHNLTNAISSAIRESRLEKIKEKMWKKNELLHNLDIELYKIPMGNSGKKFKKITSEMAKLLGAEKVVLMMPGSSNNGKFETRASYGRIGKIQAKVNNAIVTHICRTGKEVILPGRDNEKEFSWESGGKEKEALLSSELRKRIGSCYDCMFAAPVHIKKEQSRRGGILGVIIIETRKALSQEDIYLIYDLILLLSGQLKDEMLYERERDLATKDELTGLNNRRYLLGRADEMFKIARRYSKKFSIVMIDIDFFKEINDTYGHEAGDRTLVALADVFRKHVREVDVLGRYGGEEFIILLPETDMEGTVRIAERIRTTAEKLKVQYEDREISFTISCGIATFGENSGCLDGITYQVKIDNERISLFVNSRFIESIEMSLTDIESNVVLRNKLQLLFKEDPEGEQKRNHIRNLLKKLISLDGLIAIADGRLYTSKVAGRNRTTIGPW